MANQLADLIKRCESVGADEQHLVIQGALMVAKNNGWIDYDTWDQGMHMLEAGAHESAALLLTPSGFQAGYAFVQRDFLSEGEQPFQADVMSETVEWVEDHEVGEEPHFDDHHASAATPALALTAACLKAWQARMEKES